MNMKSKSEIHNEIQKVLEEKKLKISGEDFDRPWGGFFKIANESLQDFISIYFNGVDFPFDITKFNLSPKILAAQPGKRLSWQSHERRSELWRVVKGPVGVYLSSTDEQPADMQICNEAQLIEIKLGTRHRLVGLDDWGIVAEIWVHQFPDNSSDENDIRRISDDYGR